MRLHLIGGFLGSGKTTAIIAAARLLMNRGLKVAVVTNDQGKYLVDTAFVRLQDVPAVEVTGGCFCCHYDDLDQQIDLLRTQVRPDVIFAESVGSCGDLVATVIRPLLNLRQAGSGSPTSFSVLVDSRLLLLRLQGEELPFSENIVYLFDQQIAEAPVLILNKIDLLTPEEASQLSTLAFQRYPDKRLRLQNSFDLNDVTAWVEQMEAGTMLWTAEPFEMDYARYGDGEMRLAWLDGELLWSEAPGRETLVGLFSHLRAALAAAHAPIGHLKFLAAAGDQEAKISFPTLDQPDWPATLPELPSGPLRLTVNARAELPAEALRELFLSTLSQLPEPAPQILALESFHPGFPSPTHRVAL